MGVLRVKGRVTAYHDVHYHPQTPHVATLGGWVSGWVMGRRELRVWMVGDG